MVEVLHPNESVLLLFLDLVQVVCGSATGDQMGPEAEMKKNANKKMKNSTNLASLGMLQSKTFLNPYCFICTSDEVK